MPLTLRLIFHSLRGAMLALMMALTAWVALTPASAAERAALGARLGEDRPDGLVPMRVARAFVHFAPERAAQMLSDASNGEISKELAGMMLRDLAKGQLTNEQSPPDSALTSSGRENTTGAKFIQID